VSPTDPLSEALDALRGLIHYLERPSSDPTGNTAFRRGNEVLERLTDRPAPSDITLADTQIGWFYPNPAAMHRAQERSA
jgi:hypothetical protein